MSQASTKKTQTYEENVTKNSQTSEKKVINWWKKVTN